MERMKLMNFKIKATNFYVRMEPNLALLCVCTHSKMRSIKFINEKKKKIKNANIFPPNESNSIKIQV